MKTSIEKTVGLDYELLVWHNGEKALGLCEVYNKMAAQARYPYLCFIHEDILFETENWGKVLTTIFENEPAVSLIGVAGSTYKSCYFSGWYTGIRGVDHFRIIHDVNGQQIEMCSSPDKAFPNTRVACIDGVFMACRKSAWEALRFGESYLSGFHFYDIDFSLRAALTSEVIVTSGILIKHITQGGDYGDRWVEAAFQFHNTMKHHLPYAVGKGAVQPGIDMMIIKNWLDRLKSEEISFPKRIKWIHNQQLYKKHVPAYAIAKFLLYRPLHLKWLHGLLKKFN